MTFAGLGILVSKRHLSQALRKVTPFITVHTRTLSSEALLAAEKAVDSKFITIIKVDAEQCITHTQSKGWHYIFCPGGRHYTAKGGFFESFIDATIALHIPRKKLKFQNGQALDQSQLATVLNNLIHLSATDGFKVTNLAKQYLISLPHTSLFQPNNHRNTSTNLTLAQHVIDCQQFNKLCVRLGLPKPKFHLLRF